MYNLKAQKLKTAHKIILTTNSSIRTNTENEDSTSCKLCSEAVTENRI